MTAAARTLTVPLDAAGERLDRWLTAALGMSRSAVQRLMKDGLITVDGAKPIPHQPTRPGQTIIVQSPEIVRRHEMLIPRIVQETADFLVLDKPAGLLVHPTPRGGETTLVDWLLEHDPAIRGVGEADRPGIVHRLDRDVSGLMVVAKTPEFFTHLQHEFREHRVEKVYTGLVIGSPATDEGEIRFLIARSRRQRGRMAARPVHEEGREALTRYRVVERFATTTLLSLTIETGRTHQIRAHCFAIGHPIVGDKLYRAKSPANLPDLARPFLHATDLAFRDQDGTVRRFHADLPQELKGLLSTLRNSKKKTS
ncbi:MAG: RluA family pseudouridine synthase [Candidatus Kerfeldbacteria bacterium]|nr:RluA family pseudouridine synthase [Candidatus Kerfeldbacteria bacterium]